MRAPIGRFYMFPPLARPFFRLFSISLADFHPLGGFCTCWTSVDPFYSVFGSDIRNSRDGEELEAENSHREGY